MKAITTFLLALFVFVTVQLQGNTQLQFDLTPSLLVGQQGNSVTFSGTLRNAGSDELFLNGTNYNLNTAGLSLDDSSFFANAPSSLLGGQSWSGDLFSVAIGGGTALGTHSGSFSIVGGTDSVTQDLLATANFNVDVQPVPPQTQAVYDSRDFESAAYTAPGVGVSWSDSSLTTNPGGTHGVTHFLGEFSNADVRLALSNLPVHETATLDFDLYILKSWDGSGGLPYGPDIWSLDVVDGPSLLYTTFCNSGGSAQSYPGTYPDGSYPSQTGGVSTTVVLQMSTIL